MLSAVILEGLLLAAIPTLQAEPVIVPGATESSPSRLQYFSWINNTNERSTEARTLANLEFFKWLHDEYGMKHDIYAFDAGNIDTPQHYGNMRSDKFKARFPRGFEPVYKLAKCSDCRLGVWLGPDGFGGTPAEEQRAPSYQVSPLENQVPRSDRNHSYFIPLTPDMVGKPCAVVVLAFDPQHLDITPDVWQTTGPDPYQSRTFILCE